MFCQHSLIIETRSAGHAAFIALLLGDLYRSPSHPLGESLPLIFLAHCTYVEVNQFIRPATICLALLLLISE